MRVRLLLYVCELKLIKEDTRFIFPRISFLKALIQMQSGGAEK